MCPLCTSIPAGIRVDRSRELPHREFVHEDLKTLLQGFTGEDVLGYGGSRALSLVGRRAWRCYVSGAWYRLPLRKVM